MSHYLTQLMVRRILGDIHHGQRIATYGDDTSEHTSEPYYLDGGLRISDGADHAEVSRYVRAAGLEMRAESDGIYVYTRESTED